MNLFRGRTLLIVTKHKKEEVIFPPFEKAFGMKSLVDKKFDTDTLGTFSGEIERKLNPLGNAKAKCLKAMELNNSDLAIANEGSFGAHPLIFFSQANEEIMVFIDKKLGLEISAKILSTKTNFKGKQIKSEEELLEFAEKVDFPEHGIILRKAEGDQEIIIKDISSFQELKEVFEELMKKHHSVYAETDMRAMNNPTRMQVIKELTEKLIQKIQSTCPACSMPGFGVSDVIRGLRCSQCNAPTKSTLSFIYKCEHCDFRKEEEFPHQKKMEDPMYCNYCNP